MCMDIQPPLHWVNRPPPHPLLHVFPRFLRTGVLQTSSLLPFADSKLPHILLSSFFLVAPGAIAWAVDRLWRLYRAEEKDVTTFLPAWAWQGVSLAGIGGSGSSGSGASGSGSEVQRPREQTAAEARALAVLRASGQAEGEQQGDAATAALGQQAQGGTLKPFVELAYGELCLGTHTWVWTLFGHKLLCLGCVRMHGSAADGQSQHGAHAAGHVCNVHTCRLPAAGVHRHPGLLPGQRF